jgi:ribosome-interacting GTPase 1
MPTNLPAEYYKVEEQYKAAETTDEKIRLLEALISTVPKHKGTDHLRADLRRRLSKLKAEEKSQKKAGRHVSAYHIEKEGAGPVTIVGMANVGKSALLVALTNATPEVAAHPFSTWAPTPGMLDVGGAQIQLIDTPPLNPDYVEPAMMDLIRRSELLLLVVDLQADPIGQLEEAVALLEAQRIYLHGRPNGAKLEPGLITVPFLVVVNKHDDAGTDEDFQICCELMGQEWPLVPISTTTGRNLDDLKGTIFDRLEIMRIYARPPGEEADLSAPYVMPVGSTVEEFAAKVHRDFYEHLKSARIWGSGAFDGQLVGRDQVLRDGDVVELKI